jgi:predicted transposase YdaD
LISFENISPDEWEKSKIEASKQKVIKLVEEEKALEIAQNLKKVGISTPIIAQATGLSEEEIEML